MILDKIISKLHINAITFEVNMKYRHKRNVLGEPLMRYTQGGGENNIDRNEYDTCGIPFLFCPICGKKSKHDISKESFYYKFQLDKMSLER